VGHFSENSQEFSPGTLHEENLWQKDEKVSKVSQDEDEDGFQHMNFEGLGE
jgi:hypothetical protein